MDDKIEDLFEVPTYLVLHNGVRTEWTADYAITKLGTIAGKKALFEAGQHLAHRAIDEQHASLMRQLTGGATIEERDTWQSKELASVALLAETATAGQIQMLTIEAGYLSTTPDVLAAKIIAKADAFKMLIGLAAGIRGKAHAAVDAAKTEAQLDAVGDTARTEIAEAMAQLNG